MPPSLHVTAPCSVRKQSFIKIEKRSIYHTPFVDSDGDLYTDWNLLGKSKMISSLFRT